MATEQRPSTPPDSQQAPSVSPSSGTEPSFWRKLWNAQRDNIQTIAIALILAVLIRLFVAEPRFIPSDSMVPTLQVGDRLVIEKVSYHFHPPVRGDIVVFEPPFQLRLLGYDNDQAFIKRVIGEPGDLVQVLNGVVYVNQKPLAEGYTAEPPEYTLDPVEIPAGQYFVMGDNRNNSNDSHVWGYLPQENIIGRAVLRFFPFSRVGWVDNA